jgi:hypothetical protein
MTRGGAGNESQRSDESLVGQHLRMNPMRDFAQLADRLIEAVCDLAEHPAKTSIAVRQLARRNCGATSVPSRSP